MSDIHILDSELRALTAEYEQVWNKNEKIWNTRNIYVAQLFKTTDDVERARIEVVLKHIEDICEKTQDQCIVLYELINPPNYDDDDYDDSRHHAIMGDCC
jgi:UDP-glucose 6-dehydrogenase